MPRLRAGSQGSGIILFYRAGTRPGGERALLPTKGETLHDHIQSISRRNDQSSGQRIAGNGGALVGVGCERQGPVEKAGKQVDQAVEAAKDKLNPEGPVEKAGKKVDQAVEDAKGK